MKHHLLKSLFLVASLLTLLPKGAAAQYPGWQHSGSIFILTTPEGADLPHRIPLSRQGRWGSFNKVFSGLNLLLVGDFTCISRLRPSTHSSNPP